MEREESLCDVELTKLNRILASLAAGIGCDCRIAQGWDAVFMKGQSDGKSHGLDGEQGERRRFESFTHAKSIVL